jgi:hypothetical protein
MGLVGGVVVLNAVLLGVGYGVLAAPLRGLGLLVRASYAGVALLVGTALVGVALCVVAPLGPRIGLAAFLLACGGLAAAGLALSRRRGAAANPLPSLGCGSRLEDVVVTLAAFALVAVGVIALIGGFRSSPWLDDTWYFWLPKGRALDTVGLDPSLWTPDRRFTASYGDGLETLRFIRPDNPLWWSILLNAVMRFVGPIDMRAVNGESAFLLVAFLSAALRLLWGRVRSALLLPALLVVFAAPELLRQSQGGAADVPLAIYTALALLCAAGWLVERSGFALFLAFAFSAAAISIKSEGLPELVLYLGIVSVAGWRSRRALLPLWGAFAAATATTVPWLAWRSAHDVSNVFSLSDALSPSYLSDRTELLRSAAHILGSDVTSIRQWSLIVPLVLALGIFGTVRDRSLVWLVPAAFVGFAYVFFVWISWADPQGGFRLIASAYRYVTPPIVAAGVFLPVLAEKTVGAARQKAMKA